jgi:predicted ribosomally synthesized peptide with SipW-like signal peptide
MPRITRKKYGVIAAATAILLLVGGIAYAYWTSTGTGTGSATTGDATEWDVQVDDTTQGILTPNGPKETINFTVHNVSDGVQAFSAAAPSVTGTSNAGCTAGDFAVDNVQITYGSVAAGGTVSGTFDLQMVDTNANQDACKNVTVDLEVAVS